MKRCIILIGWIWLPVCLLAQSNTYRNKNNREDFDFFWKQINDEYAYFNKKKSSWEEVKQRYAPMADTASSRSAFVSILEKALYELYDHHCNLNTNNPTSFKLVPTSADVWAEYIQGKPFITEVRMHSGAAAAGITAGMEIIAINEVPITTAVAQQLPATLLYPDTEAKAFTLRLLLAGNHLQPRKFTLQQKGIVKNFYPDDQGMDKPHAPYNGLVETRIEQNIGYIRINNCLYDNNLIPAFDSVMQLMATTKGLILDLRETPSGGNTTVARAILSWFTRTEQFYQKHVYYAEEKETGIKRSWEEIVSPRPGKYYRRPLVILVNHWTGSIAEGITIGFESLHRANTKVIGTNMARLNGAVYSYELPHSKIGFSFTAEQLYTVNGQPRENYTPGIVLPTDQLNKKEEDPFMKVALQYLKTIR